VNGGSGVEFNALALASGVAVRSSVIARNGAAGIYSVRTSDLELAKNTIVGNVAEGVRTVGNHTGAAVIANFVAGNGGNGVTLEGSAHALKANRLIGNGGDGAFVDSSDTLVQGNTAVGNAGDGLSSAHATTTFKKNAADANGDWGIVAPVDVLDGGGNTARANLGLACSDGIACPPPFTRTPGPTIPTCGMMVTESIELGADAPICVGTSGLLVAADGITIDLNGYTIQGDRSPNTYGIHAGTRRNVTIQNGVVRGFGIGIAVEGDGVKIVNVEVRDHLDFGAVVASAGVSVQRSVFVNNSGPGLFLYGIAPKVSSSFLVGNDGDGLKSSATRGTFEGLTSALNFSAGIRLDEGGGSSLQKSTVAANREDGVRVEGSSPATVAKNLIAGNATDGIVLATDAVGIVLGANLSAGNGQHGIVITNIPDRTAVTKNACSATGPTASSSIRT
jgi:hypothetical protein